MFVDVQMHKMNPQGNVRNPVVEFGTCEKPSLLTGLKQGLGGSQKFWRRTFCGTERAGDRVLGPKPRLPGERERIVPIQLYRAYIAIQGLIAIQCLYSYIGPIQLYSAYIAIQALYHYIGPTQLYRPHTGPIQLYRAYIAIQGLHSYIGPVQLYRA